MSSDRRKSKCPQKCEDFEIEAQISLNLSKCEQNIHNPHSDPFTAVENVDIKKFMEISFADIVYMSGDKFTSDCFACALRFTDWNTALNHLRKHRTTHVPMCVKDDEFAQNRKSVACSLCQEVCENIPMLLSHVRKSHSLTQAPHICPYCGRTFSSSLTLIKHIDCEKVSLKCPICSASFRVEYELYVHIGECLPTFHPIVKKLVCSVCSVSVSMKNFPDHMFNHSWKEEELVSQTLNLNVLQFSSKMSLVEFSNISFVFLCEICDRKFNGFKLFRDHLTQHNQDKIFCEQCLLNGFDDYGLLFRHLVLRCPRRNMDQLRFADMISTIGKDRKLNFFQIVDKFRGTPFFEEGIKAWSSHPLVGDAINNLRKSNKCDSNSATDIELLTWLTRFENDFKKAIQTQFSEISDNLRLTENIRKRFPEVLFLHDVDSERLHQLHQQTKLPSIDDELTDSFTRLEWEAQYLRTLQPFSANEGHRKRRSFSPLYKHSAPVTPNCIDQESIRRLEDELELNKLTT